MNRAGFSLLELLVVIAIIAILTSIAVPALRQSRGKGQEILCAANLRQISMAISIYGQENKTLPQGFCDLQGYSGQPPTGMHGHASYDWQGWWWFDFIADTIGTNASKDGNLWCPSSKVVRDNDTDYVLSGNYGINNSTCRIASAITQSEFMGQPLKSGQVQNPVSSLLVMDSGYSLISWKALSPYPTINKFEISTRQDAYYLPGADVNSERTIHPNHIDDAQKGRHGRKNVNIGYTDGHVGNVKTDKITPVFDNQGKPENYSAWSTFKNR